MSSNINVSDLMSLGLSSAQIKSFMTLRSPLLSTDLDQGTPNINNTSLLGEDPFVPFDVSQNKNENVCESETHFRTSGLTFDQQIDKFLRRLDRLKSKKQFLTEVQYVLEFLLNLLRDQKFFEVVQVVSRFAEVTRLEVFRQFKMVKLVFYLFLGFALKKMTGCQTFSKFLLVVMDSVNSELVGESAQSWRKLKAFVFSTLEELHKMNVFEGSLISRVETYKGFEFILLKSEEENVFESLIKHFRDFVSQIEFYTEGNSEIKHFDSCNLVATSNKNVPSLLALHLAESKLSPHSKPQSLRDVQTFSKESEFNEYHFFPLKNMSRFLVKPHEKILNITKNKSHFYLLVEDLLIKEFSLKAFKIIPFENEIILFTRKLGNLSLDPSQMFATQNQVIFVHQNNQTLFCLKEKEKGSEIKKLELPQQIKKVTVGDKHCLVLTKQKELYGLGENGELQLGLDFKADESELVKIDTFDFEIIEDVFAGPLFSLLVNNKAEIEVIGKLTSEVKYDFPTQLRTPPLLEGEQVLSLNSSPKTLNLLTNRGRVFLFDLNSRLGFVEASSPENYFSGFDNIFLIQSKLLVDSENEAVSKLKRSNLSNSNLFNNSVLHEKVFGERFECKVVEEVLAKAKLAVQATTSLQKVNRNFKKGAIKLSKISQATLLKSHFMKNSDKRPKLVEKSKRKSVLKEIDIKTNKVKNSQKKIVTSRRKQNRKESEKKHLIKIKRRGTSSLKKPIKTKTRLNNSKQKIAKISKSIPKKPQSKVKQKNLSNLENLFQKSKPGAFGASKKHFDLFGNNLNSLIIKNKTFKNLNRRKSSLKSKKGSKQEKVSFVGYMKTLLSDKKKSRRKAPNNKKEGNKSSGFTNEKIKNVLNLIN